MPIQSQPVLRGKICGIYHVGLLAQMPEIIGDISDYAPKRKKFYFKGTGYHFIFSFVFKIELDDNS